MNKKQRKELERQLAENRTHLLWALAGVLALFAAALMLGMPQ